MTVPPVQPSPQTEPTAEVLCTAMDGDDFARTVARLESVDVQVLLVVNGFTACAYQRHTDRDDWIPVCRGELSGSILDATTGLRSRKRLTWAQTECFPLAVPPASLTAARPTVRQLRQWLGMAEELTGREGEVSPSTREQVAYRAGWRCQFSGCGVDLHTHAPTGRNGRFSYYAHIVASSRNGPRGHATRSALLADEPDNIMLLCDACHRLVDRIDPAYYTEEMLQCMRQRSVDGVKRLLDTLQYQDAEVVAIIGSIAGQVPEFNMRDAELALWESHLRATRHTAEFLFHVDHQLHDVHTSEYWAALFRSMRSDSGQLQRMLTGVGRGGSLRPRLAIFPLHTTSVLLVAGRILGENSGTHLFQPQRSVAADAQSTRWAWPLSERSRRSDKFKWRVLKGQEPGMTAANLIVSLTFGITPSRLPPGCFDAQANSLTLPTLEVYVEPEDRGIHLIGAPEDLQDLGRTLDRAVQILHDEWHVDRVNLFIGAPTTAVVTMGQKMQARDQATYVCHESQRRDGVFLPTIEISSRQVREPRSGQAFELQP